MWDPRANTDDENVRFCLLRAIEWNAWPSFISQPIAPIAFLFLPWGDVVAVTLASNFLWGTVVAKRVVIVPAAYWGCLFVRLKWVACPLAAIILGMRGQYVAAVVALLWPLVILLFGPVTAPMQVGKIQEMFMERLGYTRTEETLQ
ncbi:MAG: hypothetical protein ACLQBJ_11800 [Bryobacteraceae bacterium]